MSIEWRSNLSIEDIDRPIYRPIMENFSHPFASQSIGFTDKEITTIGSIMSYGIYDTVFCQQDKILNLTLSGRQFINKDLLGHAELTYDVKLLSGTEYDMYYRLYGMFIDMFIRKTVQFMPRIVIFSSMPIVAHRALDYFVQMKRCVKVVYYVPLFEAFDCQSIKPLLSANTVLVSAPLITEWGRIMSKHEAIGYREVCRSQFHTPFHIDFTIAACDSTRSSSLWNQILKDIPILSASISHCGLIDTYILALDRHSIMHVENDLGSFLTLRDNHLGYAVYYMHMKLATRMVITTDVSTADWHNKWLSSFREFGKYKILRLSDIIRSGMATSDSNALIVVSDNDDRVWADALTFFVIRGFEVVTDWRPKKEYVLSIDLSSRLKIDNSTILSALKHCFVLTRPSNHLLQHLLQIELPLSIEQRQE